MFKRLVIALLVIVVVGVVGLAVLAYRPALDPITPPARTSFAAELVAKGEMLAGAGYCATCHTAPGGQRYAGGYAMTTGFGTIWSTNITPDPQTGIGRWSEAAFRRALREGVARDGAHLFPVFPYQHFNQIDDADIKALYAYFMTREPAVAPARKPDMAFPLNVRALQAGWKLLYFRDGAYGPVSGNSAQWNRGAYLAEGLAHCSACHSPRNALGAEQLDAHRYTGAVVDGWYAPPLDRSNPAPVRWSEDELYAYLRHGATPLHGVAAGAMAEVVHGLGKLPDEDLRAIAVYFAGRAGAVDDAATAAALARALTASAQAAQPAGDAGARLFASACASCHYNSAPQPLTERPELGLNSAVTAADPSTLIQVILHGVGVDAGLPGVMMPGFAHSLGDEEVASLAAWLRRTRSDQPPWPDLPRTVAALRAAPTRSAATAQR
ncbi:MAG: aldehyde dehydrogenase [Lysobacterales bacterium 69-70]|nr:c-type cytochrome [Xanthomonadaceae bacterium]ODU33107.1 MAG: aldehyde dehydrogenase [Xanthomonadaceae bacterium SCN 69-320]ODV20635.1 MAG: aldehyde dehydrogenase [Xanthomonadaceae bacterium SCN 69-25]OJZ00653.1 MAG: aldehyde dehydrogenase [Xanthomonadales bacterium 69-70]